jgi:RNA polymerase sigma-70 factor (ECF subfamily)
MEIADDSASLVEKAKKGSHSAFTELVRLHHAGIRSFLRRFLHGCEATDDLAQEVFLAAYRQLDEYRGPAPFRSWLMGIARNRAMMYMRSEARRRRREEHAVEVAVIQWQAQRLEDSASLQEEHDDTLAALRSCIDELPPASKFVVDQYYFGDESTESIARALNKKSGAVRMMLMRVRRALGKCIAAKLSNQGYNP